MTLPALGDAQFAVLPVNMPVVEAFCLVSTQWRYTQGVRVGLDYAGCKVALDAAGVDIRRVFNGLRVMEAASLEQ